MLKICTRIFDVFEERGIRYCHWKSNEHLEPGLAGETDLDILVDERDKKLCLAVYKELKVLGVKSQFGSEYPYVEDYVAFDDSTGKLIHLHQHYRIVTGHTGIKEYTLPYEEVVLSTCVRHEKTGVYVSRPEAELYLLYLRAALKCSKKDYKKAKAGTYKTSEDVKREIAYLKRLCSRESCASFYKETGMDPMLTPLIWDSELTTKQFLKLYEYVYTHFRDCCRLSPLGQSIMVWVYPKLIRADRALRKRFHWNRMIKKTVLNNGLSVAFIGQDGCGKSTVTKELEKWFLWKMDAQRFYLGSGDYYNPWQKKVLALISEKKSESSILAHISGILSVSLCCAAGKHALKQLRKAHSYVSKGGIALFDRFPQVQYEGIFDGPKIRELFLKKTSNQVFKKVIESYAKKEEKYLKSTQQYLPDIIFKLLLSVDESMRRKPGNHRQDIVRKNYIADHLLFEGTKTVAVNAENVYKNEILLIKNDIWQALFDR